MVIDRIEKKEMLSVEVDSTRYVRTENGQWYKQESDKQIILELETALHTFARRCQIAALH